MNAHQIAQVCHEANREYCRLKEHPCMVPYSELPVEQRLKDSLFKGVVRGLSE